jgi:YD repeat-containing protein
MLSIRNSRNSDMLRDKTLSSVTRTIDSVNYQTPYGLNSAGVRTQITYLSGRVVNLNCDSAGRISSMTDASSANYLSGISYNTAGQVTGQTLGNGVVEAYGYDTNRLQLTSQTATSGATSLINLTYSYAATAGQNGANTTARNGGQLMSLSVTIGGQTESAAFTYDLLNRLVTSNQTTNSTTAQRRFVYDRFGNRTAVYDATTGGNQFHAMTADIISAPNRINRYPRQKVFLSVDSGR